MKPRFRKSLTVPLALFLAAILVSPAPIMKTDRLELDAASYLAHGFTLGLDLDLDYRNEPYDRRGYFNPTTELPNHPIGPGVLAAPFVALFSLVDRVSGHPVIEDHNDYVYSWSKFGFFLSGVIYFFAALLLIRSLSARIAPALHPAIPAVAAVGSGVAYYAFHDGYLGHQFEFFCLALSLWASVAAWYKRAAGSTAYLLLLLAALGIALGHLVRPANLNTLLLPFIVYLSLACLESGREGKHVELRSLLVGQVLCFIPVLALLGLVYVALYGTPFPLPSDMYAGRGSVSGVSDAASEGIAGIVMLALSLLGRLQYLPGILFGSEFGLLYCCSVAVFGVVSLFALSWLKARSAPWRAALLAASVLGYLAVPGAVVLYWQTTASAYGWRYLFSIIPLGLLGVIAIHAFLTARGYPALRRGLFSALVLLSLFGVLGQAFWGTSDRLHFNPGPNTFDQIHGSGNCCSGMGYVPALLGELGSPTGWFNMLAHRFPGYLAFRVLDLLPVDPEATGRALGLPADKLNAGIARYSGTPLAADLQVILVFLLCAAGLWYAAFAGTGGARDKYPPADNNGPQP